MSEKENNRLEFRKLKADEIIDFSNLLSIYKKPLEKQKINES